MIWLLNWLDADTVILINWILIGFGVLGLVTASFLKIFAFINIYRLSIQLASVLILVFGIYYKGALEVELEWKKRVHDLEQKVAEAEAQSQKINTEIVTKIVTKVQKHTEYRDKIRTEIQVKKEFIDRECKLTPEAVDAYNKAVTGVTQ